MADATLQQLLNEVNGEKTASVEKEDPLDNVISKEASSNMTPDVEKTAREWAEAGRDLAQEEVNKVASVRQEIANEYGEDTLKQLDALKQGAQMGKQAAMQEFAALAEQQKEAEEINKVAEEYGEETAQDYAKLKHFEKVGRNLADQAVMQAANDDDVEV